MDPVVVLMMATPLALAALGETVGQRSGVINIGLEGCILAGAFFAMLAAYHGAPTGAALLAGMGSGLVLALGSGYLAVVWAADQVVVGTAVNLLALGVTDTLLRDQFGQGGQLISVPRLAPILGRFDAVLLATPVLAAAIWFGLNRTGWGLATRAAGEYPKAATAAGYSVTGLRLTAMGFSGLMGGLAGAYLTLGVSGSFASNASGGRGFVAIAVVTFGRWRPGWVVAVSVLIGVVEALQFAFQARGVGVPYQLMLTLPYVTALGVLVIVGRGTAAPEALGVPYRRSN